MVARGGETILVVEDEESVRRVTRRILEKVKYRVCEAANSDEALAICARKQERIDLVLSDVVMPGMNGLELMDRIRALRPGMKVVLMSGYVEHAVAQDGNWIQASRSCASPSWPTLS